MPGEFHLLLGYESGPLAFTPSKLAEFLDDPREYAGIREFKDAAYLGENPNINTWPDGVGVLLRCEAVVPRAAGKYVLP